MSEIEILNMRLSAYNLNIFKHVRTAKIESETEILK